MEIFKDILAVLTVIGIPSGVSMYVFNRIMKRLDEDKKIRDENMCMLIGLTYTAVELSEATAISYKNGRCNGEITSALDKSQDFKQKYTDFITHQCVKSIR